MALVKKFARVPYLGELGLQRDLRDAHVVEEGLDGIFIPLVQVFAGEYQVGGGVDATRRQHPHVHLVDVGQRREGVHQFRLEFLHVDVVGRGLQ